MVYFMCEFGRLFPVHRKIVNWTEEGYRGYEWVGQVSFLKKKKKKKNIQSY